MSFYKNILRIGRKKSQKIPNHIVYEVENFFQEIDKLISDFNLTKANQYLVNLWDKIRPYSNNQEMLFYVARYFQLKGSVQRDQGQTEQAKNSFSMSLKTWDNIGRMDRVAENIFFIGACYEMSGDLELAKTYYENALVKFKKLGNKSFFLPITNKIELRLGTVFTKMGSFKKAHEQFNKYKELNDLVDDAYFSEKVSILHMELKNFDDANLELEKSIKLSSNAIQKARSHIASADFFIRTNDLIHAPEHLEKSHQLIELHQLGHLKKNVNKVLYKFENIGNLDFSLFLGENIKKIKKINTVILTALPVEFSAIRSFLKLPKEITHPKGTIYEKGYFNGNHVNFEILLAEIGSGNANAAFEAERAIEFFEAQLIIFFGVAGGIKDVALGDIVIGTKIYGYESGQSGKEFLPRPSVGESDYSLEQRAKASARQMKNLIDFISPDGEKRYASILTGPIAAGEKVVRSRRSSVAKFLTTNYGDTLAVEMEGRGFLTAVRASGIKGVVIRGISDLLDNKTTSDSLGFQEIASKNAAKFTFHMLKNLKV